MWPFKKKCSLADSGVFLGFTDWHTHILLGVDDGVQTMDEALKILDLYEKLGIKTVWLTPHVMEDIPNTTVHLKERFKELQTAYKGTVHLHLAAEYMLNNLFQQRLDNDDLLPLGKKEDYLLVETSYYNPPANFYGLLERIRAAGYYPVLAHPERYAYLEREDYRNIKEANVKFQLNILSLSEFYGMATQENARWLQKKRMYDFTGTDIHRMKMLLMCLLGKIKYKPLINA